MCAFISIRGCKSLTLKWESRPNYWNILSVEAKLAISKPYWQLVSALTATVRSSVSLSDGARVHCLISNHPPPEDFIMGINAEFSGGGLLLMTERANHRAIMFFFEINNEWRGDALPRIGSPAKCLFPSSAESLSRCSKSDKHKVASCWIAAKTSRGGRSGESKGILPQRQKREKKKAHCLGQQV